MTTPTRSTHTPGPWKLSREDDGYRFINAPNHAQMARVVVAMEGERPRADLEANAALIAAAPELLALVRDMLPELRQYADSIGGCDHAVGICTCGLLRLVEDGDALLARIEGREPCDTPCGIPSDPAPCNVGPKGHPGHCNHFGPRDAKWNPK